MTDTTNPMVELLALKELMRVAFVVLEMRTPQFIADVREGVAAALPVDAVIAQQPGLTITGGDVRDVLMDFLADAEKMSRGGLH